MESNVGVERKAIAHSIEFLKIYQRFYSAKILRMLRKMELNVGVKRKAIAHSIEFKKYISTVLFSVES